LERQTNKQVKFPIKYLESNLVFHSVTGAVFAYYEWMPHNYAFISEDQAGMIARDMEHLIALVDVPSFHLLDLAVEENIGDTIERSKKEIRGDLSDVACSYLDGIREHLESCHGRYEVGYRHYIGFQLAADLGGGFLEQLRLGLSDFKHSMDGSLFGDYTRIDNREVSRYLRLEQLLYHKISKQFTFRRTEPKDIAYIVEHLNGKGADSFESYTYEPEVIVEKDETKIKSYDVIRLADSLVANRKRHLDILTEDREVKVAYLALSDITNDLLFPFGSEVLYYQQESFDFPVDTSIKVEVVPNKDAVKSTRNKKADLKDLDESALSTGNDSSENLLDARAKAQELEAILERERGNMYKVSYLVRVSASSENELLKRVEEVKSFYWNYKMIFERPLGDQLGFHEEFYPGAPRYLDDYVHYVRSDFLSCIGFGATHKLGEREGIYLGYDKSTGRSVYIKPWLAAQGVAGSVTNALAKAFIGSLGGGKSVTMNLIAFYSVLFGGRAFVLDPKGERGNWERDLGFLGDHLNIISIANEEGNRGLCDPFVILNDRRDAEYLAIDILTFLMGYDPRDPERFPVLKEHVKKVAAYPEGEPCGMLHVIQELYKTDTEVSRGIARHMESFADLGIAGLLFGDGSTVKPLRLSALLNVVLIHGLSLPDAETPVDKYTMGEMLSVALLLVLSYFSLEFINQDRGIFKVVLLDEAWSWLQVAEGKAVSNKLVRAGRSMNAGIDFGTQNCADLLDEKMKNNIGMKFAFRSRDKNEIRKTLEFMGLEYTDSNIETLQSLENGECLYQDIRGHVGVLCVDCVFQSLLQTFDTRPPVETPEAEKRR